MAPHSLLVGQRALEPEARTFELRSSLRSGAHQLDRARRSTVSRRAAAAFEFAVSASLRRSPAANLARQKVRRSARTFELRSSLRSGAHQLDRARRSTVNRRAAAAFEFAVSASLRRSPAANLARQKVRRSARAFELRSSLGSGAHQLDRAMFLRQQTAAADFEFAVSASLRRSPAANLARQKVRRSARSSTGETIVSRWLGGLRGHVRG
jgi:predicted solute-binding protein